MRYSIFNKFTYLNELILNWDLEIFKFMSKITVHLIHFWKSIESFPHIFHWHLLLLNKWHIDIDFF